MLATVYVCFFISYAWYTIPFKVVQGVCEISSCEFCSVIECFNTSNMFKLTQYLVKKAKVYTECVWVCKGVQKFHQEYQCDKTGLKFDEISQSV